MVPAQNFSVLGLEVLPAIPRTIDVQEQGTTWVSKIYYQKAAKLFTLQNLTPEP